MPGKYGDGNCLYLVVTESGDKQWLTSLENHAFPFLDHMSVSDITSADILRVLSPIWVDKTDTAKKIRQQLRMVFKWSKAQGYYSGDDPVLPYYTVANKT